MLDMTPAAARRIVQIASAETQPSALRITVEGGGCSGFSYAFDMVPNQKNADDIVIERDGATLLVDELSLVYMKGSVVDFVDDLIGQSFKVNNPNAVANCGCGTSFSI